MERTNKIINELILNKDYKPNECDSFRIFNHIVNLYKNNLKSLSKDKLEDFKFLLNVKENSKLFLMKEDIKHLLLLTKPSDNIKEINLPFDNLFIDSSFDLIENKRFYGLQIVSAKEAIKDSNSRLIYIISGVYDLKKNGYNFFDFAYDLDTKKYTEWNGKENKLTKEELKLKKIISDFITNLLLFLNEPRVTTYIIDKKKPSRPKPGLIPIPSQLRTKIHIDLKRYIDKIYITGQSHSKLGYSYWCRGHWRSFTSPRYVNKKGQKTWILPHIKGEGLMPPQVFEVCK